MGRWMKVQYHADGESGEREHLAFAHAGPVASKNSADCRFHR
jgi:hypothetical protein